MKIRSAIIKLYISVFGRCKRINDKRFVERLYLIAFGKFPDLKNPKTFNEHICAMKITDECYGYSPYVDKAAVREYVKKTVGDKYLNDLIGIYKSPIEIPFDKLPSAFAIKCTHASGYNIIVSNKDKLNWSNAVKQLEHWLSKNYYYVNRERNYKNIKPQILIDKYIQFDGHLREYKVYCFHGRVKFIAVNVFCDNTRKVGVYDSTWNYISVNMGYKSTGDSITKPDNLNEMVSVSEKLASSFPFVRVDLYNDENKIIFSELTFTSGGGLVKISPESYDYQWGGFFEEP